MDINSLLKGFDCPCGKRHSCGIDAVYIENDAISRLAELCADEQTILLVCDENTFAAAGEKTLEALRGKKITRAAFSGRSVLVPDESAVSAVEDKLKDAEMIVGIGSGVIQDLCKYVSFRNDVPYIIVATAPSMDGYASDGAAMITDGMKVTYPARLPRAIVADTQVLASAPEDMIKSGIGDVIGKFSALNDWRLSQCVTGEYFCEKIYEMTLEQVKRVIPLAEEILKRRDEKSISELMNALVSIGIFMSFAGSSRPASGSEHHMAHFFEITGLIENKERFSHGINVAFSSYIAAKIYKELQQLDFADTQSLMTPEENERRLYEIYGPAADKCMRFHIQAQNGREKRLNIYRNKEKELREILNSMVSPEKILEILSAAGLDIGSFYSMYGEEKISDAVLLAKDLKSRFTVLWIWHDLFVK